MSAVEANIPSTAEGYYLKVAADGIVVAGSDDAGTYYGVQTLLQILAQPEVMSVEIKDYPACAQRGVIEGFYGNPWSDADRKSQFDFYGKNKLNIYVYGPKDDPYHRTKWRENYPDSARLPLFAAWPSRPRKPRRLCVVYPHRWFNIKLRGRL